MAFFVEEKSGGKTIALLSGIGFGAALMYVLDPERGRRRRALARDKAISIANKTGDVVAKRSRDIANRARGVAAEARSVFESDEADAGGERRTQGLAGGPNFPASERRSAGSGADGAREPLQMSGDPGKSRRIEDEGEL